MIDPIERQMLLARYMAMPEQRLRMRLLHILAGGSCSRDDLAQLDAILHTLPGHDTLRHAVRFLLAWTRSARTMSRPFSP